MNYFTVYKTDRSLVDGWIDKDSLIFCCDRIVAGAPDTTPNKYTATCTVKNRIDNTIYVNNGTPENPDWMALTTQNPFFPVLLQTVVEIPSFLTCYSSPIVLVPSPDGNHANVPSEIEFDMLPGGTQYNTQKSFQICYADDLSTSIMLTQIDHKIINNDAPLKLILQGFGPLVAGNNANPLHYKQAIVLSNQSSGTNPSQGDGTARVKITYRVFGLPS